MGLKRREFMTGGAMAAGAFVLGFALPGRQAAASGDAAGAVFAPNAFIRITADSGVTVITGKSEMGQNVYTGLTKIVAEELDAHLDSIRVEQSGVDAAFNSPWFPVMMTGGSSSTTSSYETLRRAGATARAMLLAAAAEEWGVPVGRLTTRYSRVHDSESGREASYGDLAAAAARQPVPAGVALKPADSFRLIGHDTPRLDSGIKVRGEATFGIDVRLPEMKYAVVARPPMFGATLESFDETAATGMPGVIRVKRVPSGIAVIADSTWRALQAREALKINWARGELGGQDSEKLSAQYRALAREPGHLVKEEGDSAGAEAGANQVIEAVYEVPFLAHACMEPLNCTVHDRGGSAEIWAGTQSQTLDRDRAAKVLGYEPASVKINTTFLGGGFGRRAAAWSDFVVEGAQVAKGEPWPVKTTWTREDDMRGGQYRPMTVHRSRLALDAAGRPLSWHNRVVSQGLDDLESLGIKSENHDWSQTEGITEPAYAVPNYRMEAHLLHSPVTTLWWRSVGHSHTAFLKESLFDEAAHAAGADPLEYRLGLLEAHPRYQAVLRKAAGMAGWGRDMPKGTGLGIAVEESYGTIVAEVAQVRVEGEDIRVEKVWCAVDCGFAVNPLGVRSQMEGAIVFGLSAALHGEITLKNGRVEQGNFNNYRLVRMGRAPVTEVEIINSGAEMGGIGEPGTPPIFAAVGNAIFAASGQRLRSMPFRL